MSTDLAALVIALVAFGLSCATTVSLFRLRSTYGRGAAAPKPYNGPAIGETWPLGRRVGLEIFVAVSRRCPACAELLASLTPAAVDRELTLLVVGSPLDEELPSHWTVESFNYDLAKSYLGVVATPYAVIVRDGLVAGHAGVHSADQLQTLMRIVAPEIEIGRSRY